MGRHGKNATANPVYSYRERKRDAAESGWGTQERRIGTDSVQDVDCCRLTLQIAKDPVITPHGYLYDREAILTNLLHQKTEHLRKTKEYERQKKRFAREQAELSAEADRDRLKKFEAMEQAVSSRVGDHFKKKEQEMGAATRLIVEADKIQAKMVKTAKGEKAAPFAAFWVPGLTPEAKPTLVEKPAFKSRCPISGKPLKLKDLTSVKFTLADKLSKASVISREERYMCAVTQKAIRKGTDCAVLKPSGRVVTMECVNKLIRPDMTDPISGAKLSKKDIIVIKAEGTGFAGSGADLFKTRKNAVQMAG